jgi:hypothetical protein
MKKANNHQFHTSLKKDDLINYVKNELSFKDCIAILMFDENRYCDLFQQLWMEESLINESDIFIVLQQRLKDESRNELIDLIEKNIPHEDLIKILTSIMTESTNNIKSIKP